MKYAGKVLKDYLVNGYALNEKRFKHQEQQQIDLKNTVNLLRNVVSSKEPTTDEADGLLKVISDYSHALEFSTSMIIRS